ASVATVAVLLIGSVDYLSGNEISWSIIYALPIALAAWYVGRGLAYALSVLSVLLWIFGEFATGLQISSWLVPVWNTAIRLAFYYVVVGLLFYIRTLTTNLEVRVLERTADLSKEIVERERLEHELLEIGERERRRIGYDLHDGLGQHLTGISLALQVLRKKLVRRGLPEAEEASKAVALIEEGIALSHKLAKGLQPVEVHAGGLMQALQEFSVATSDMFSVTCKFRCDAPILISDVATAGHLYRIVQEATSNAVKHGHATSIVITLEANEEGTSLRVADDGVGMPRPDAANSGMGLRIMRQRAKLIGATLEIVTFPNKGTVISCSLPYAADRIREARRA
ncbi:MAG TPA: sensor histidine kinase, partial [Pyrinomonadaceae bacterium]|nr:sensor histidine kinase [Pyrinomonadaceae bacterium]